METKQCKATLRLLSQQVPRLSRLYRYSTAYCVTRCYNYIVLHLTPLWPLGTSLAAHGERLERGVGGLDGASGAAGAAEEGAPAGLRGASDTA